MALSSIVAKVTGNAYQAQGTVQEAAAIGNEIGPRS
jgi:hypothetical protein